MSNSDLAWFGGVIADLICSGVRELQYDLEQH